VLGGGGGGGRFTLGERGHQPLVSLGLAHVPSLRWIVSSDERVSLRIAVLAGGG